MSVVKEEANTGNLCHGCLTTGRRTAPLGDCSVMFFSLVGPLQPYTVHSYDDVKVCWECRASLRKLRDFQNQLKTAQHMLLQILYRVDSAITPLSKLSTTKKDSFDYEINYLDTPGSVNPFTALVLSPPINHEQSSENLITTSIIDTKNIEPALDSKDINVQNITLLTTIVKEEILDDNDYEGFDYNYYDTKDNIPLITKQEKKPKIEKQTRKKKKKKEKSVSIVTKYRKYARLLRTEKAAWGSSCDKYFTKVNLTEMEIEEYLNQTDRTQRGYATLTYKCKVCMRGYLRAVDYYRHKDLNHHKPGSPYQCRVCKKVSSSLESLTEHWRHHCNLYRCNMCADYCKPRMLKRHLNQQHTNVYGCVNCRLEFGSLTKFAVHYKESHGTFVCDYCNKVCGEKRIIEKHITRRHLGHYCKKCNRQYKNYPKYRDHLRLFHPKQLNKNANLELAYCVECDRQYPSVYKYKIHIKESPKHTPKVPVEPIPCPECGKNFSRKSYMNNHYRHSHLKVTKYHCEPCNKYYANGYGLRQHRESVHLKLPKMKDKICDICGRGFHTNGVLIKHRRTHTGERPYQCGFCSAAFAQITACKTHARTQHRQHI